jgi:hypothetical protein
MPLFRCDKCGCIENTALGNYWMPHLEGKPALCSECDTGTWHGKFDKKDAAGMRIDQRGFLWEDDEQMPATCRMVGRVPPNT